MSQTISADAQQAHRPTSRQRGDCRLCGSQALTRVFSLGATPLANAFVSREALAEPQEQFPLDVFLCTACGHVQLLEIVDPDVLFRHYVYVSSTSPVFLDHFRRYADEVIRMAGLSAGSRVIEIGSNDGALLRFFQHAGLRVLGIDPARAIAAEATRQGIETIPEFFDLRVARALRAQDWEADIIVANNVFAHADDLHGIVEGVAHLLKPDGLFFFEVSYLVDVYEKTLFDTIYHEHLSYHTMGPLVGFFRQHGMQLIDAIRVESHGGSLRGVAKRIDGTRPRQPRVEHLIALERQLRLHEPEPYHRLFATIQERKAQLTMLLRDLKQQGRRIAGFGAPAKATTLMYHFGLGPEILDYLIDDSPLKQGLYSPGHHLPVVPSSALYDATTRPDDVLILAWNFAESIIAKHEVFRQGGGRFIIPLPTVHIR